jgi:hypothetical protein
MPWENVANQSSPDRALEVRYPISNLVMISYISPRRNLIMSATLEDLGITELQAHV